MITTREQYKATCALFDFLDSIGIEVTASTWNILAEDYGGFEPCTNCGEIVADCNGECDDGSQHGRYYAEYDDEASFD